MARFLEIFKSGNWVERDRLVFYPLIILALTVASTAYVLVSNDGVLPNGSPFGSDFVSFWVAAREALSGHPAVPYLAERFAAAQNTAFGDGNFYAFYYPPHYLAYMLPFGILPYYPALIVWSLISFGAATVVIFAIVGRRWEVLLLTLAFPATFLTVAHGQNAFLSAALFGAALVVLPTRPVFAGVLFGLLTFKPQLGLLIPVALIAGGYWRTVFSAAVSLLVVVGISTAMFGADIWLLFVAQGSSAAETLREGLVGWNKMISTYAAMRLNGAGDSVAMAVQILVSLVVAGTIAWAWKRSNGIDHNIRAALLITGSLLATPFGLNYDLFLLAPVMAFLVAHGISAGFPDYRKSVVSLTYLSPIAVLWLMDEGVSIAPFILVALFAHVCLDARRNGYPSMPATPAD